MIPGMRLRDKSEEYSADALAHPYLYSCPAQFCYYAVSSVDEVSMIAKVERHHYETCPMTGYTHIGGTMTATLLEQAWEIADSEYDKMLDADLDNDKLLISRGELDMACRIIALFMKPFLSDKKAVADELRRRRNARETGQAYETIGLGSRRYEYPDKYKKPEERKSSMPPAERAKKVLDDKQRQTIKLAVDSGLWPVDKLAKMYDVSEEVIRAVAVDK